MATARTAARRRTGKPVPLRLDVFWTPPAFELEESYARMLHRTTEWTRREDRKDKAA